MFRCVGKVIAGIALLVCLLTTGKALADGGFIGGTLTANTTLTPTGNPWTVFDTIIIPEGVTLTIESGTLLNFMINTHIAVYGTLLVTGTAERPVICKVKAPTGSSDKWRGIKFRDARTLIDDQGQYVAGSLLRHLHISGADDGITLSDSSVVMASDISVEDCGIGINILANSKIHLSNSKIENCSYGISFRVSSNNRISGCTINNCGFGIMFHANNNFISSNNIIHDNNLINNDVSVFLAYINVVNNIITDNRVLDNGIGLHIGNGGENDHGYNRIEGNIVANNEFGIKLSQHSDTVRFNDIRNNKVGLELYLASGNNIENNVISLNTVSGIQISEGSTGNILLHNNVYNNFDGVKISGQNAPSRNNRFEYNRISENSRYTFYLSSGPQQGIQHNVILSDSDSASFINADSNDVIAYHNYWGTTLTNEIDLIIRDANDDPLKGEVLYNPFDGSGSNEAPIAKPGMAIKQLINNEVRVTWRKNTELDLAGYKLYHGTETVNVVNVSDTTYTLQDILLSEEIKLTAVDTLADGDLDQFEGHESAYTTAIAAPYAGGNSFVCSGSNFFTSTATAIDYIELKWLTEGDGTFANEATLYTYYVPGAGDLEAGYVHLSLSLVTASGIHLHDKLKLTILEDLISEAGSDTTITEGSVYSITKAVAENFTSLEWITSGDGAFDDSDTLHTNYIPGTEDIKRGYVNITLRIFSDCGLLDDSFKLEIVPGYFINGSVTSNNTSVSGSMLLAYNVTGPETKALMTVVTDSEGKFSLGKVGRGDFYIYAIPDPDAVADYFPTYYATRFNWSDAHLLKVENDLYDVDVELQKLDAILPVGVGSIKGTYSFEGYRGPDYEIYNRTWYGNVITPSSGNSNNDLSPAPNHVILLMNPDMNKVLGWTLSDINGAFNFEGLPFGQYRLWGEKAGYTNKISSIIYITPDHLTEDNVQLTLNSDKKTIEATLPVETPANEIVFPNPIKDRFYISTLEFDNESNLSITLFNNKGVRVHETLVTRKTSTSFGPVYVSQLQSGLYYCVIKTNSGAEVSVKLIVTK